MAAAGLGVKPIGAGQAHIARGPGLGSTRIVPRAHSIRIAVAFLALVGPGVATTVAGCGSGSAGQGHPDASESSDTGAPGDSAVPGDASDAGTGGDAQEDAAIDAG